MKTHEEKLKHIKPLKFLPLIIVLVITFLTAASCSSDNDDYEGAVFDIDKTALTFLTDLKFGDELVLIEDETVQLKYNFGGDKTVVYAGSGATPEIIIAVKCSTRDAALDVFAKIDGFIGEQKNIFDDYNTSERPKLDEAVYDVYGSYVFCVVSADTAQSVEAIIKSNAN